MKLLQEKIFSVSGKREKLIQRLELKERGAPEVTFYVNDELFLSALRHTKDKVFITARCEAGTTVREYKINDYRDYVKYDDKKILKGFNDYIELTEEIFR